MKREEALNVAKPILFNTDMVRAIQDNIKTATRRLIKLPYYIDNEDVCRKSGLAMHVGTNATDGMPYPDSPYKIGDILYVRETWTKGNFRGEKERYYYKADNEVPHCRWEPSIHMPKEAARIFLRVTDVRVERLQDMTDEDCVKDGGFSIYAVQTVGKERLFGGLWNSTVKKSELDKYGWEANPWVFVYEFEMLEVTV